MLLQEFKVPFFDVSSSLVVLDRLFKQNFDLVKKDEILFTVSSAKYSEDFSANSEGYIFFYFEEGKELRSDDVIARIYSTIEESQNEKGQKTIERKFTKKAKELADKFGVNIMSIEKEGIITENDVKLFIDRKGLNL